MQYNLTGYWFERVSEREIKRKNQAEVTISDKSGYLRVCVYALTREHAYYARENHPGKEVS